GCGGSGYCRAAGGGASRAARQDRHVRSGPGELGHRGASAVAAWPGPALVSVLAFGPGMGTQRHTADRSGPGLGEPVTRRQISAAGPALTGETDRPAERLGLIQDAEHVVRDVGAGDEQPAADVLAEGRSVPAGDRLAGQPRR